MPLGERRGLPFPRPALLGNQPRHSFAPEGETMRGSVGNPHRRRPPRPSWAILARLAAVRSEICDGDGREAAARAGERRGGGVTTLLSGFLDHGTPWESQPPVVLGNPVQAVRNKLCALRAAAMRPHPPAGPKRI
jgi:hypothetical protein